jgi:hypothetical protein
MSTAEVHPFAQKTYRLLNMSLAFPTRRPTPKRYRLLDLPEVLLVASLIVATKHQYPLDGIERIPREFSDPLCLQMDWTVWESEFAKKPEKKPGILQYEHMDPQEIWSMDKDDMDELLNWFQETQIIEKPPAGEFGQYHSLSKAMANRSQTKRKSTVSSRSRISRRCQSFPSCPKRKLRSESREYLAP